MSQKSVLKEFEQIDDIYGMILQSLVQDGL